MAPIIILVGPQMGENIGAVARAMKNFNVTELRIVNPRDGWPNEAARANAVGAVDIIDSAKIYENLEGAIADIEHLYATSATSRDINKDYVLVNDFQEKYPCQQKVGIMFGRENCGLTNKEISIANKILTINTGEFSSLNLAQAVIIVCYELFRNNKSKAEIDNSQELATKAHLSYFFEHLFVELENNNFFKTPEKKLKMTQNIINIFSRIDNLSNSELQTLRGIIKSLSSR